MDTPLKQRIVGAIVLVALGVIFIPAILDGSGYKSRTAPRNIEIPVKPVFPPLTEDRVKPVPTPLDEEISRQASQQTPTTESPDELKSWMLQVGSFESRKNAEKKRDELRDKGFTTHVIEESEKGKLNYRVRIGPEVERKRIEVLRERLKKQGVDSFVVSHG